jgi:Raf kinase inhibitor-like YbhB/YbcL family protein
LLGLAACGSDGRELRPPDPDQTTSTSAAGAAGDAGVGTTPATADGPMSLSSPTLTEGAEMPVQHTCQGEDISPSLLWSKVPSGTAEVAVVMRDLDADGFVHWVLAGLAPDNDGLAEGVVPEGAVEANNDFGQPGWAGPCPPSGTHHYEITVYALAERIGMQPGLPGPQAAELIETAPALAAAVLSTTASAS